MAMLVEAVLCNLISSASASAYTTFRRIWWLPACIDDIIIDGDGEADMCTRSSSSATSRVA